MPDTGLTALIVALISHPDPRRASPTAAAEKFKVREDWARHYIESECSRRGI